MKHTCQCGNPNADRATLTISGKPCDIVVCERCDRARCVGCNHSLPPTAARCPNCGLMIHLHT